MYEYDMNYVQQLSRLSELQRRELARYYVKMPEKVRIEAFAIQTDLIRQHRPQMQPGRLPEYNYAMLLLALVKMRWVETGGAITLEQAKKISEIRIARAKAERRKKDSPTRYRLEVRHAEEIKRLRDVEKFSWREIAAFLAKHYRLTVSHTYVQKIYNELYCREV